MVYIVDCTEKFACLGVYESMLIPGFHAPGKVNLYQHGIIVLGGFATQNNT